MPAAGWSLVVVLVVPGRRELRVRVLAERPAGAELGGRSLPALILGRLRLLLSGPTSSAGRPMPDGATPAPGGWNRIHLLVDDIESEVDRLRRDGVAFRNDIVTGPGGSQILVQDPAGNVVELFQPAGT